MLVLARDFEREVVHALGPSRETELDLRWSPRGHRDRSWSILTGQQLAIWIVLLAEGEWAVLELPAGDEGRCGQVMRVGDDCIVEVHDGSPGDWASRVLRDPDDAARPATDKPSDLWHEFDAAEILWAWLHGSLPRGCRRERLVRRRAGAVGDTRWCTADLPRGSR
jgi:hypothetical protein